MHAAQPVGRLGGRAQDGSGLHHHRAQRSPDHLRVSPELQGGIVSLGAKPEGKKVELLAQLRALLIAAGVPAVVLPSTGVPAVAPAVALPAAGVPALAPAVALPAAGVPALAPAVALPAAGVPALALPAPPPPPEAPPPIDAPLTVPVGVPPPPPPPVDSRRPSCHSTSLQLGVAAQPVAASDMPMAHGDVPQPPPSRAHWTTETTPAPWIVWREESDPLDPKTPRRPLALLFEEDIPWENPPIEAARLRSRARSLRFGPVQVQLAAHAVRRSSRVARAALLPSKQAALKRLLLAALKRLLQARVAEARKAAAQKIAEAKRAAAHKEKDIAGLCELGLDAEDYDEFFWTDFAAVSL